MKLGVSIKGASTYVHIPRRDDGSFEETKELIGDTQVHIRVLDREDHEEYKASERLVNLRRKYDEVRSKLYEMEMRAQIDRAKIRNYELKDSHRELTKEIDKYDADGDWSRKLGAIYYRPKVPVNYDVVYDYTGKPSHWDVRERSDSDKYVVFHANTKAMMFWVTKTDEGLWKHQHSDRSFLELDDALRHADANVPHDVDPDNVRYNDNITKGPSNPYKEVVSSE